MELSEASRTTLEHLRNGKYLDAFTTGVVNQDPHALALGAAHDHPEIARFRVLREMDEAGSVLATELVLLGVESESRPSLQTEAWKVIEEHADKFILTAEQAERLEQLVVTQDGDELADDQRGHLLRWVDTQDADRAAEIARGLIEQQPGRPSSALESAAHVIVGRSRDAEDHQRIHRLATELLDANQTADVSHVLAAIAEPLTIDVEPIGVFLSALSASNGAIPPETGDLLRRLDSISLTRLISDIASTNAPNWVTAHLLPAVIDKHLRTLVDATTNPWWPDWATAWLVSNVAWDHHPDDLLTLAITNLGETAPVHADTLRAKLQTIVTAATDQASANQHPRKGAGFLLAQSLNKEIPGTHPALIAALRHVEPTYRLDLYLNANWRKAERAEAAIETILAVDPEDLVQSELQTKVACLSPNALGPVLEQIAPAIPTEGTASFVLLFADDEASLEILASHSNTRSDVFSLWQEDDNLGAFEALIPDRDGSEPETDPLSSVETKARDYNNGLSPSERIHIVEQADPNEQTKLLGSILHDRGNPASNLPTDELLIVAISKLGEFDEPQIVLDTIGPVGNSYPNVDVRIATLESLGAQTPTAEIAGYLQLREDAEVDKVKPAATSALNNIADRLDEIADSEDRHLADPAVAVLAEVRPERALHHAQARLSSPDAETRRTAATVLGAHGDPSTHTERLEVAIEHEPDLDTREAMRSAVRRLTVGDEVAAHEYLGQLAGIDAPDWDRLNIRDLYDDVAPLIVSGLDRVVSNQASRHWGTAIDQLSEVAKYLLYRTIAMAGPSADLSANLVGKAAANGIDYGTVLRNPQLYSTWIWIGSLSSLYQLRTEHLTKKNDLTPVSEASTVDFDTALRMFRQGMNPCLTLLRQSI